VLAVLAGLALWAGGLGTVYLVPLVVALLTVILAALDLLARRLKVSIPLVSFGLTVVAVNLAFAMAWVNVVLRRRMPAWQTVAQKPIER
jgi:hypothetical protein